VISGRLHPIHDIPNKNCAKKFSTGAILYVLELTVKISDSYRKTGHDDPKGLTDNPRRSECNMTHIIAAQIECWRILIEIFPNLHLLKNHLFP
jgi:hypothetical protein